MDQTAISGPQAKTLIRALFYIATSVLMEIGPLIVEEILFFFFLTDESFLSVFLWSPSFSLKPLIVHMLR